MDVLFVPGFVSNVELNWELPRSLGSSTGSHLSLVSS